MLSLLFQLRFSLDLLCISGWRLLWVLSYDIVLGSCGGRGTRAAAWFADYIESQQDTDLASFALEGGIKGWVASGSDYTALMDGYDASHWASK